MSGTERTNRCVDCGNEFLICDHVAERMVAPQVTYWMGVCDDLRADLAAAVEVRRQDEEQLSAIREMVGALDDESTLEAVRDMATEWEHYSKEMNKAGYETIPSLTRRAEQAEARLAEATAALEAIGDWEGAQESVVRDSTRSKRTDTIRHQVLMLDLVRMVLGDRSGALVSGAEGSGE